MVAQVVQVAVVDEETGKDLRNIQENLEDLVTNLIWMLREEEWDIYLVSGRRGLVNDGLFTEETIQEET